MRRFAVVILVFCLGTVCVLAAEPLPKLVLVITVDGLPQEQVVKFQNDFGPGGFNRLLRGGAWFSDAQHGHATTYTAVGHSAILTGAYPYRHGIVGNEWWDRAARQRLYCCADPSSTLLDESTPTNSGTSPRNLQVTTVGDELRVATGMRARVLSVSVKDRGAIFTGGKTGQAYWLSKETGRFVTSTYYESSYPAWWQQFHARKPQDAYRQKLWEPLLPADAYWRSLTDGCASGQEYKKALGLGTHLPMSPSHAPNYDALRWTPFGDDYTADFLIAAMQAERLGRNTNGVPDLLAVSFSCHDEINHLFGPESLQSQDDLLRLDRTLARLFEALDLWVGLDNVVVALTADHGFANSPEFFRDTLRFETGRIDPGKLLTDLNRALGQTFGEATYAVSWCNPTINFDPAVMAAKGANRADVERAAVDFLQDYPGIHTVFTRTQLLAGSLPPTRFGLLAARSWHRQRSGDLFVIQQQGWYLYNESDEYCTTHGSPWAYDTHVPLMFLGKAWVRPGRYDEAVEVVDLAATLASLLDLRPPSGCEGRVLQEMLCNGCNRDR
jgi:predicted AlkP superfamily pyrophosphatase or phosphodiesterase